jgi:hypothetical protein
VYGDSYQSKLVAVVVPHHGPLKSWAKDNGKSGEGGSGGRMPLCGRPVETSD